MKKAKSDIPKVEFDKIKAAKQHFDVVRDSYEKRLAEQGKSKDEIGEFEFNLVTGTGKTSDGFKLEEI